MAASDEREKYGKRFIILQQQLRNIADLVCSVQSNPIVVCSSLNSILKDEDKVIDPDAKKMAYLGVATIVRRSYEEHPEQSQDLADQLMTAIRTRVAYYQDTVFARKDNVHPTSEELGEALEDFQMFATHAQQFGRAEELKVALIAPILMDYVFGIPPQSSQG